MDVTMSHTEKTLEYITQYNSDTDTEIILNGEQLNIVHVLLVALRRNVKITIPESTLSLLAENSSYLSDVISNGAVVYGVNTGYGGSADVRSNDICNIQTSLIRHLNAGFGDTISSEVVRGVMLVRANSLCRGYSGVRPEVVQLLVAMIEHDIIPVVPKRGSVSASGDLMPTSYIAACMMARPDAKVIYKGQQTLAPQALKDAKLQAITFISKEALAVVNAASFASTMASMILYDANIAVLLTQVATAMSVESLRGRVESFHPTIHQCMAHQGQIETASNIHRLLTGSQLTIHSLDMDRKDHDGVLKQDRYALRTSPQWLAPVLETLLSSVRRVSTEINSANDNPIIDHRNKEILHGGNFQGVSITVAMDQSRQSLQLCGKLLFAQLTEILNWKYSDGLPPNLSGCDIRTDFGYKGTDTAMASYCSELDYLTNPLTNHVLSAEMHNQAVNSMALVSARMSTEALEILQMMLANILCAQVQAIDLRWLQQHVEDDLLHLVQEQTLTEQYQRETWPWYTFAFTPREEFARLFDLHVTENGHTREKFVDRMTSKTEKHLEILKSAAGAETVAQILGTGTRQMYLYIRQTLAVPFYDGSRALDSSLQTIYDAIRNRDITQTLRHIFAIN